MKVQTSVSVEEGLRNRVAEAAAVEGSSFSAMWALLVELGFTVRQGERPVSAPDVASVKMLEPEIPVVPAKPPKNRVAVLGQRTKKCMHQIPADRFCKFGCDKR